MTSETTPLIDASYYAWVDELKARYRVTKIKASVAVNTELLTYYWGLGKDISEKYPGKKRFVGFFDRLSADLRSDMPFEAGFSPNNLRYTQHFYELYSNLQQRVGDNDATGTYLQRLVGDKPDSFVERLLVLIPWGHHIAIIDKCGGDVRKALFYVRKTLENQWSRDTLKNWISTDLYSREGKALSNFQLALPAPDGDLAQQLTKDPYIFNVQGLTEKFNETELKKAMCANAEKLLMEMGKGFAFVGREFIVNVGGEEKQIDLLFYFIPLHRYFIVEVKMGDFEPADLGQLQGYVGAVDLTLNRPGDNPAMGLLVCKGKNSVLAKYMLSKVDMPLAISDYELSRIVPEQYKNSLPSIEDIENELELKGAAQ